MKTKIHKITLFVVDHADIGASLAKAVLEEMRYPNDCIHPSVMGVETKEVEWSDDHPLNNTKTQIAAAQLLFEKKDGS